MEPTGRREGPPDDRLRAIRDRGINSTAPDFAALHPGYGPSWSYAGLNPACVSAARPSSEAKACKNACTAGRSLRAVTSAKS